MEDVSVTVESTSTVVPVSPSQKQRLFLPAVDSFWRWLHYNQRLLFYKTDPESYSSFIDSLKTSLSLVLVDFYPFAGRLAEAEDGRLEIDCNDAGVEFVEATVDVCFSDLEEDNFQIRPFFKKLAAIDDSPESDKFKLPVLLVQVTRFLGGEIVIGCAHSHVVADGSSFWHFMTSWAELARGVDRISVLPVHMRTALDPKNFGRDAGNVHSTDLWKEWDDNTTDTPANEWHASPKELTVRVFHFSGEMIRKLKSRTHGEGEKGGFTSYEALCAHMWRRVTIARGLEDEQRVGFAILADVRKRLVPALPAGYFGNAIHGKMVMAKAGELRKESAGRTAARLQEEIRKLDDGRIKEGLRMMAEATAEKLMSYGAGVVRMNVASSPRFRVFEADFGWGAPAGVRPAWVAGDGEMVLFAGKDGGGSIDVCLALSPAPMHKLQHDAQFLSFSSTPSLYIPPSLSRVEQE